MIKLHEVHKGEGYYSLTFSDGFDVYGAFIMILGDGNLHIEFMEFTKNQKEIISITKESDPEKFIKLKEKYLDVILKDIEKK